MSDIKSYNVKLSIFLNKKLIYNDSVKSLIFIYENYMSKAYYHTFKTTNRLKKIANYISLKISIKISLQKF